MHGPTFTFCLFKAVLPHGTIVAKLIRRGWLITITSGVARCAAFAPGRAILFSEGCRLVLQRSEFRGIRSTGISILLLMVLQYINDLCLGGLKGVRY